MAHANEKECIEAGLDPSEVERIAKGLERYLKQAAKIGVKAFGGSNGLDLRFDDGGKGDLIVGDTLATNVDGGDGGCIGDSYGHLRGEF